MPKCTHRSLLLGDSHFGTIRMSSRDMTTRDLITREMLARVRDTVNGAQVSAPFGKVDLALQVFA